jgi:hypothetical protein
VARKNAGRAVGMRLVTFGFCLAMSVFAIVGLAAGQQAQEMKPKVSDKPFTAEQLAVYRAVLTSWYGGDKAAINLAFQTNPINPDDDSFDKACLKGLILEKAKPAEVHRFRGEDPAHLGFANLRLVDPELQAKEVRENDPGNSIGEGKSVDDAVDRGFAHGLFTLGEIQFDQSHTHAIVSFSFWCGRLCGHGTTMLMEKKNGAWKRKSQCGGSVS